MNRRIPRSLKASSCIADTEIQFSHLSYIIIKQHHGLLADMLCNSKPRIILTDIL